MNASKIYALGSRIDDWMNPITVRELRQAVGGRFLPGVLILFLTVQLLAIGTALWSYNTKVSYTVGREVFLALNGIVVGTCILFIPAYAGFRFSAERSDTNIDLLFITTLRPTSIVWGKFMAAMVIVVLIFAASAPFLSLTYLLRGIDLPTIFLILGISLMMIASAVMIAIFLACIPANRPIKLLLLLIGLGVMIQIFTFTIGISSASLFFGGLWGGSAWSYWLAALAVVAAILMGVGLLFVLAVTMIAPPPSNRSLLPRLYLTGMWLVSACIAGTTAYYSHDTGPIMAWAMIMSGMWWLALLAAVSERDAPRPRILRAIPANPLLRLPAFLFYSGAAGGIIWTLLMMAATFGAAWTAGRFFGVSPDLTAALNALVSFTCYVVAYDLTALLVRRTLLRGVLLPQNTYAIALILMAMGSIFPLLIVLMIHKGNLPDLTSSPVFITVPFAVFSGDSHFGALVFSAIWAGAALVLLTPWIINTWTAFRRPAEAQPAPPPITVTPAEG